MALKFRRRAVLAKIEDTYGTDAEPTGAANAIQLSDVTLNPMEGEEVERNLVGRSIGEQGKLLVGLHTVLEASVELAGSGTAGDAPAYGPLLRACGFSETIDAGVEVVYAPVSADEEAASIYFNLDGQRFVMLGARGTTSFSVSARGLPRISVRMTGLWSEPSAGAYPTGDFSAFVKPLPVSKANTTFALHGFAAVMHSLEVAQNNEIAHRDLVNEESVIITDRGFAGTAVIDMPPLATKNFFAIAKSEALAALQLVHGTTGGNIAQIDAAKVQIGRPTVGEAQGVATLSLPIWLTPDAGDDDFTLTVK
ncbi:hypothetical protein KAJ83_09760 [Marivibrio halodurans]|uniref:Uncharacterized protein n=1 Tax=Marivibrio halodurans TaxID=2039722 RepID=A0A8J7S265_9PROT|nr:phage tail tube protein [Marivibrio halodurans]MBP5857294.1 hypothetical protein [Marivibrio halodurans]